MKLRIEKRQKSVILTILGEDDGGTLHRINSILRKYSNKMPAFLDYNIPFILYFYVKGERNTFLSNLVENLSGSDSVPKGLFTSENILVEVSDLRPDQWHSRYLACHDENIIATWDEEKTGKEWSYNLYKTATWKFVRMPQPEITNDFIIEI